ncbi:RNA methyltransferase [Oceanivirga salmonicida]|uniref:RNA methyltransferase n=1 Tax=Oceanivirga salmonicida TaxID=1769291 RepID=UPI0012E0CBF7|nr:RNA methyltransferase [Oceanivirga salmonicida]
MRDKMFVALVHYPVYNRNNEIVATSVTNFDIHDISRTCRTYDIANYYIITPVQSQIELTNRIIGYWQVGDGIGFNKDRNEAFENTLVIESIEKAIDDIIKKTGKKPRIVTTSARIFDNSISYKKMSEKIKTENEPILLLFGTGFGLTDEIMNMSYHILEPIRANTKYNHLSVRSAVSIILDRLLGED